MAPIDAGILRNNAGSQLQLALPSQLKHGTVLESLNANVEAHVPAPHELDLEGLAAFQKAANYLAAAQIYLKDDVLLRDEKLDIHKHVKPRLLGHFGTCPGLIFVYAHVSALLRRQECRQESQDAQRRMVFVAGPGHGAPGPLACLYLEGTISHCYPQESMTPDGLKRFIKAFSWPNSTHPSHINASTPGAIHEGGELGYALSVSYGAAMDKPDLIVPCVVGDGENETGPAHAAWHGHKFIDPKESGAVLPILHVNRFKISEKTIYGSMDEYELLTFFSGYGYQPRIVSYWNHTCAHTIPGDKEIMDFDRDMAASLEWAVFEILAIQQAARTGIPIIKPRWPMIILLSPKGWGLPPMLDGKTLENSFRSHQVPISVTEEHLSVLEDWLRSYEPHTWFAEHDGHLDISHTALRIFPKNQLLRMGRTAEAYGGKPDTVLPDWRQFTVAVAKPAGAMDVLAKFLLEVARLNKHTFRVFSPDELESNHLGALISDSEVGGRNFQVAEESRASGGRVVEVLSEHLLEGFAQGYSITGRVSVFPSYEGFLPIIATMAVQFAKFIKDSKQRSFREPYPSLTYIASSTLWRQEHNGFSHQNPGFINTMIDLPHDIARIYLPPDANCALTTMHHALRSLHHLNVIVASKEATMHSWLDADEAQKHCIAGGSVWRKYSTDDGKRPDVVLVGIGVQTTAEVIAAASILRKDVPEIRVRVVNVTDLLILAAPGGPQSHPHALSQEMFSALFTVDKPIVFNFHGYPTALKGLVAGRMGYDGPGRVRFLGYREEGTTTTPWTMLRGNGVDRYSVSQEALSLLHNHPSAGHVATELNAHYEAKKRWHEKYVEEYGDDPADFVKIPDDPKH
ncbi:phosphoketolase [Tilletiaria anomala UBC 951]|uniref:Phosphoketolase n=1 Tax=Tilletiaria anomala (strain ATCC 24038 / CBS 436.72 / UBC 951) TaxID=1037660 RepID=A0A066W4B7_TILAU|nr:phosphoketolase [Tilletiaria anomala UBC 951]KDN45904.1 phosphoketolase [Tilletiaria anomala UBC 951]